MSLKVGETFVWASNSFDLGEMSSYILLVLKQILNFFIDSVSIDIKKYVKEKVLEGTVAVKQEI